MCENGFWGRKSFVLITGASRGFGQAAAINFSKRAAPGSIFLLISRSLSGLEKTRQLIHQSTPSIQVFTKSVDLSSPNSKEYFELISNTIAAATAAGSNCPGIDHAILVHNALMGAGDLYRFKVSQYENLSMLQEYWTANFSSMVLLTTEFLKIFTNKVERRTIVQISSLAGVIPCKSMCFYGAMKAARMMHLKSLSVEEQNLATLSYAPGVMDTEAFHEARVNSWDKEFKNYLGGLYDAGNLVGVEKSAGKLAEILEKGEFVKGEHTDYFDTQGEEEAGDGGKGGKSTNDGFRDMAFTH